MEIGFIGLGKMGLEMSSRAVQAGHRLVGYDNSPQARENAEGRGIPLADSLQALVGELSSPRVIWMQLPPGKITNQMIHNLGEMIAPGIQISETLCVQEKSLRKKGSVLWTLV